MKRAKTILLEGLEGCGKTTQCQLLADNLRALGKDVLVTKEPGTPFLPLTMQLRGVMLDKQYDDQLTPNARELVSQAIRSIHLEKLVVPALTQHEFIVQDRGLLSGLSYGMACGHSQHDIRMLIDKIIDFKGSPYTTLADVYDKIILLRGDVRAGLKRAAAAKQEFAAGDAMEAKGETFHDQVRYFFNINADLFRNVHVVEVEGRSIDDIAQEILKIALD